MFKSILELKRAVRARFNSIRRRNLEKSKCVHDWNCIDPDPDNPYSMFYVNASNVRFRCSKCGKEEGL